MTTLEAPPTPQRIVHCWCCGAPTGETSPNGQSSFPVCRGCTNITPPGYGHPVNVPGDPSTLYCMDNYDRNRRIGNGVIPVHPNYGTTDAPNPDQHGETGMATCDNCGAHRFRLVSEVRVRRWGYPTDGDPDDEGTIYVDSSTEDEDVLDTIWAHAECVECEHEHSNFEYA